LSLRLDSGLRRNDVEVKTVCLCSVSLPPRYLSKVNGMAIFRFELTCNNICLQKNTNMYYIVNDYEDIS